MTAPLLAVDIGNTVVKVGVFGREHSGLQAPDRVLEFPTADGSLAGLCGQLPADRARWFVSNVHRAAERRLAEEIRAERPADSYRVLTHSDVPLRIDVEAPERVGFDRLATAVAANALRSPERHAIIVDLGTALKVHAVSSDGVFRGGAIATGLRMAARALRGDTDLLPHVPVALGESTPPVIGRSTDAAIRSGIFWGAVGTARELVTRMSQELAGDPQVFVTGGGGQTLASLLSAEARYVPHLCLSGIALIAAGR